MNPFRKSVEDKKTQEQTAEAKMVAFSTQLRVAMELKEEELRGLDHRWDVGDFTISTRSFRMSHGWENLLYAYPRELNEPGWSNKPFNCDPAQWFYIPQGTTTKFYPKPEIAKKILEALRGAIREKT